jgi:hypothetical protein
MSCLDNIIGIDNVCDAVASVSGLKINDLPGMRISIAESIITSEDISGKLLIEEKIKFAQKYLVADIRNFLQDKFKLNSILASEIAGIYKDEMEVVSAISGRFRGIRIQVKEYNYTDTEISRVGIKLTDAIASDIFIYDLTSGSLLDTIPFTSIADQVVYINVNKKYRANNQKQSLFICIDASVSDQYATYSGSKGCTSCNKSNLVTWDTSGYISGQKIDSNFIAQSGTGGITVDYIVACDIEKFVCSMAQLIAWPLLYKAGAEILKELKYSRNLNSIVIIDQDKTESLLTDYEAEYTRSMTQIATNMVVPDDICFKCNPKIRKTIQIP